jgi:hypothetical protein
MFELFELCLECSECLDSVRNARIGFEMFGLISKCSDYLLPQLAPGRSSGGTGGSGSAVAVALVGGRGEVVVGLVGDSPVLVGMWPVLVGRM